MTASLIHSAAADQHQSSTSVPYARHGFSFQTREVLQRVVMGEQARIKEEQMLWRFGGTILGMFLGLGDGFQMTDLFMGMAGGTISSPRA